MIRLLLLLGLLLGPGVVAAAAPLSDEQIEHLVEEARQAMALAEYDRAVRIYTRLLELPPHAYSADALEYLGVARERKGQMAHAKRIYEQYLERYGEGDGAARVRQRLRALLTAEQAPPKRLRRPERKREEEAWEVYGALSQYYRADLFRPDGGGEETTVSRLDTSFDYNAHLRAGSTEIRTRVTAGYDYDFLDPDGASQSELSSLYIDGRDLKSGLSARLGRQRQNTGGVWGRFDGISAGWHVAPRYRLGAVAGFPVESSSQTRLDTTTRFAGVSLDAELPAQELELTGYLIHQRSGGLTDRSAIGMEARHFSAERSAMVLLDYDIHFGQLNTALALGSWTLPNAVTLNATFDLRNNPTLATSNALIGQSESDLGQLKQRLDEGQIEQLARDRTARSRTTTVGAVVPLGQRFQLRADATFTSLSATPASGGVAATPGTRHDSYYTLDLTVADLFVANDFTIFTLRRSATATSDGTTFSINSRLPASRELRINPRLRIDRIDRDDGRERSYAPSVRLTWQKERRYNLELEGGWEVSRTDRSGASETQRSRYLTFGYRYDF